MSVSIMGHDSWLWNENNFGYLKNLNLAFRDFSRIFTKAPGSSMFLTFYILLQRQGFISFAGFQPIQANLHENVHEYFRFIIIIFGIKKQTNRLLVFN